MKTSHQAGFAALCILSGSGWLLSHVYPSGIGFPLSGCIHFLLIALVASTVWVGSRSGRVSLGCAVAIALAGSGVFALPGIAAHMVAGAISEATSATLFCSTSLLTLLGLKFLNGGTETRLGPRSLLASVVSIGGMVVLSSADLPGTFRGWLYLGLLAGCCAAIALAGIWMNRSVQRVPVAIAAAIAAFGSTALLSAGASGWPHISLHLVALECLRCAVFDLPVVWLATWLIREISPARMSARYILVPVVTVLESYIAMRGGLDVRSAFALAGMIVGGVLILRGEEAEEVGLRLL